MAVTMGAGSPLGFRGSTLPRISAIIGVFIFLYLFRNLWFPYDAISESRWTTVPNHGPGKTRPDRPTQTNSTATPEDESVSEVSCKDAPGADRVMVMLKTGATELYQKLPTHFVTTFQCVPHFMIFSDLEQRFANQPVHDAIASVSQSIRQEHDDFKLYREISKWQREGQDLSKLKGDGGWNLDKWKFLPMLHQTFSSTTSDNIDWFVMMEADTSVSWTNLLQWLHTMDPAEPYYLGAQNIIGDTTFAHGGSGVIVSRGAAAKLRETRDRLGHARYDTAWEEATAASCCGDEIVARAFNRIDINLTAAWPLVQGETVSTVDWTSNHWCAPPVTWHHIAPRELDALWQFERAWVAAHGWRTPYLYRDVFESFVERHITVNRTSWNNMSKDRRLASPDRAGDDDADWNTLKDWEKAAVESEAACAAACREAGRDECIQWMFTPGRCYLGRDIRFGQSDEYEDEHWVSGWMQDRVDQFRRKMRNCEVRWSG